MWLRNYYSSPLYEIVIDFFFHSLAFYSVILLKSTREREGGFSCDKFPKLSKYVIEPLLLSLPFRLLKAAEPASLISC